MRSLGVLLHSQEAAGKKGPELGVRQLPLAEGIEHVEPVLAEQLDAPGGERVGS